MASKPYVEGVKLEIESMFDHLPIHVGNLQSMLASKFYYVGKSHKI